MSLPPAAIPGLIIAEDMIIYNTVAASAFIFWEHCITLREEIDLIWRSQWNLINALFFVIRYITLIVRIVELVFYTNVFGLIRPTSSQCGAWIRFEAASGQILVFSVEIILIMRVFAFYGRKRRLLYGLFVLFACENIARITILGLTIPKILVVPSPLPPNIHSAACLVLETPSLFSNYWVPALIFDSILFLLVAVRFVQTKLQAELDSPHVLVVFVRDGAWAFTMIFASMLWGTLAFELTPIKGDIALTWLFSVLGFCGSRLILNLRSAAEEIDRPPLTADDGFELAFQKYTDTTTGTSSTRSGYTSATEDKDHILSDV
ncbi:hypothetical protein K439DRAFT_1632025 [Ramaria rubella]|nr:hypothetical protein K439DRAFT_1632025 [Ramaria rubella]